MFSGAGAGSWLKNSRAGADSKEYDSDTLERLILLGFPLTFPYNFPKYPALFLVPEFTTVLTIIFSFSFCRTATGDCGAAARPFAEALRDPAEPRGGPSPQSFG